MAAYDDPRFEPDRLLAAASAILSPLRQVRTDDELVEIWMQRFGRWLPRYWRRTRLPGVPGGWGVDIRVRAVEVTTLRSVGTTEDAEAVVRARLRVRRFPRMAVLGPFMRSLPRRSLELWLTLGASPAGDWQLTRVDFDAAGEHHLAAETVPEPVRDPALRDAALHELAESDDNGDPTELLIRTDGAAAKGALDLSLADGRFAPAVIEAAVHSILRAWRRLALDAPDAHHALMALSSHEIAEYAGSADLPVKLLSLQIVELVSQPRAALFAQMAALVQTDDGIREQDLSWKLELDSDLEQHWRLVDAYARPELRELRAALKPSPSHTDP